MVLVRYLLSTLMLIFAASAAVAQGAPAFPSKPVRLIVPAPAGGPVDAVARILADALRESWRETVVVEGKRRITVRLIEME